MKTNYVGAADLAAPFFCPLPFPVHICYNNKNMFFWRYAMNFLHITKQEMLDRG